MLPLCAQYLRSHVSADIEAWTWGNNDFDPAVMDVCHRLGVSVKHLPDTGQYCAGWEARHHALCLTEYRHVFMLDVDTYVVGFLPWLFQPMQSGMRLRPGELWENYAEPAFLQFFDLPERDGGYANYSVWFGEYDRASPQCRNLLCKTSDLLGLGVHVYVDAGVIGDQDIRNGVLHALNCSIEHIDINVNAWQSLEHQLSMGYTIVHQGEKAFTKDAAVALSRRIGVVDLFASD